MAHDANECWKCWPALYMNTTMAACCRVTQAGNSTAILSTQHRVVRRFLTGQPTNSLTLVIHLTLLFTTIDTRPGWWNKIQPWASSSPITCKVTAAYRAKNPCWTVANADQCQACKSCWLHMADISVQEHEIQGKKGFSKHTGACMLAEFEQCVNCTILLPKKCCKY